MSLPAQKIEKKYTYSDYAKWSDEERWELIKGVPYAMTAPSRIHQEISRILGVKIANFLTKNKSKCKMYFAPFDVRLPEENETDAKDVSTVVQPDILVVCDLDKLDKEGMRGAPDFIIEILSPSTVTKDQLTKLKLYEKHGIKEYWIVDPIYQTVRVYLLKDDKYSQDNFYDKTNKLEVKTLPGLEINLESVFEEESRF